MVNVADLKRGDLVRALVDVSGMGIKKDDILRVKETGWSRWDGMPYADVKAENGVTIEIMKNFRDFVKIVL